MRTYIHRPSSGNLATLLIRPLLPSHTCISCKLQVDPDSEQGYPLAEGISEGGAQCRPHQSIPAECAFACKGLAFSDRTRGIEEASCRAAERFLSLFNPQRLMSEYVPVCHIPPLHVFFELLARVCAQSLSAPLLHVERSDRLDPLEPQGVDDRGSPPLPPQPGLQGPRHERRIKELKKERKKKGS